MPNSPRRVALYLDTYLSPAQVAHVVDLCRDLEASLLCLAPPPGDLAVSRLAPHLANLARAGVAWTMEPVSGDVEKDLNALPEVVRLVCENRSALARYRDATPAPLTILLDADPTAWRTQTAHPIPTEVNWLAPRLHRGF